MVISETGNGWGDLDLEGIEEAKPEIQRRFGVLTKIRENQGVLTLTFARDPKAKEAEIRAYLETLPVSKAVKEIVLVQGDIERI